MLGKRLGIGLCGVEELQRQRTAHCGMVTVQCSGGSWTKSLPGYLLHDLSPYSTFRGCYQGVLPRLHQSYDTTFQRLIGEFQTIWSYLTSHQGRAPVVVLFARLGGTGRFALLIAVLMWAGHVHDYSVWADLVAPVRNKRAKCELHWNQTPGHTAATVPFGDVLVQFVDYLKSTDTPHRWPAHAQ